MINRENLGESWRKFVINNKPSLDIYDKEIELFNSTRFHGFNSFDNSKLGIWYGPLLIYVDLYTFLDGFMYSPIFKIEVFDYFQREGFIFSVECKIGEKSKEESKLFEWLLYPYNENKEYLEIIAYMAKELNYVDIDTSTAGKMNRIKSESQIILDFDKQISISNIVNQIAILNDLDGNPINKLRILYLLYIYLKKMDKAKEVIDKVYSRKRNDYLDPREKELLSNPDMYIEYVNEIKKMKKYSKLKEIEVKE